MSNYNRFAIRLVLAFTALLAVGSGGFYLVHAQSRPVARRQHGEDFAPSAGPVLLVEALPVRTRGVQAENALSGQESRKKRQSRKGRAGRQEGRKEKRGKKMPGQV